MAQCKTDCRTDPDCAIRFYCQIAADGGVDGGGGSQCPPQLPLGSACVRNTQCLSGTCAINRGAASGICCNTECNTCGTCDATGNCHPYAAGTDPNGDCMDNAERSDGQVRRHVRWPRALRLPPVGDDLRPLQGLQRRRPLQPDTGR